jgi:zinc transport system substrate-binding protein
MRVSRPLLPVLLAGLAVACTGGRQDSRGNGTVADGTAPLSVYVVNHPLETMAKRIGGADVDVTFPSPPGEDPAYWSPSPETVVAYQGADVILLNGAGYAKWIAQASLPASKLVDTGAAYAERLIPLEETVTHTHGPEGKHAHGGAAFTTWLDPTLALEQARAIAAAFEKARPERAAAFHERLVVLEGELTTLDQRLDGIAKAVGDAPLIFSHPVYQYLERRYGLNGHTVHWEPDEEPIGREWRKLERLLLEHPARWMIWESEPLPAVKARLQELGITSVVFDPCAGVPAEGDLLSEMNRNVERLEASWE